ncbi:MAG: hypothetical protein ACT4O1_01985 [Gemmatimonadota bacterium]
MLAALGLSAYTYLKREPTGRGRPLLIALRTISLILIVLLLLDPQLRAPQRRSSTVRVLLDASLSMTLAGAWQRGVAEARRSADGASVLLFGGDVRAVPVDSLARIQPVAGRSSVLPALQSAAEANAGRVLLITDGAIDDATAVARWLPTLGIALDVRNVAPRTIANRALSDVEAPAWAEAGKPLTLRIHRTSSAGSQSSLAGTVVVRQNGKVVARTDADSVTFVANGPATGGLVRYDVAFAATDSIPDDDVRSIYVFISEKPAGVAIVSFDPDWEPRFLHPVIEAALGLPVRTFLRLPAGVYLRGGSGLDAGTRVEESAVLSAVAEADLVVLHGLTASAPDWAQQAARNARRLIVFPGDAGTSLPIPVAGMVEADWYVSPELPASPITSLLAGIDAAALPPLNALQSAARGENSWAPLLGGRTPRGGRQPLVVAEERGGRRWAVALGRGYWRWAFRGGEARAAYTRLWAALAGWVVQDRAQVASASIRPVQRAVSRGTPIRWIAPGIAADSFVLVLQSADTGQQRMVLTAEHGDTIESAPVEPAHYTYDVRAYGEAGEIARAHGPLTVESYSPEFMRRVVDLNELKQAPAALAGQSRAAGRALHTYPWLYVLLILLLCVEWILRRRWGLR